MTNIDNLLNSFNNTPNGWSGRKLSAFTGVAMGVIISYAALYYAFKEKHPELIQFIFVLWLIFALLCLSVITFEQVIKFKNGGDIAKTETNGG